MKWIVWIILSVGLGGYFSFSLIDEESRGIYLPGETTTGHYQIEMKCEACHDVLMGVKEQACRDCHLEELKLVEDSHPKSKFTDPRNADRVALLDARRCVTCHAEHRPQVTHTMGVTLPDDFCYHCHIDIAADRPSHAGMEFDTCASAGCHNFHDNKALYEDFLLKHQNEPEIAQQAIVPLRNLNTYIHSSQSPVLLSLKQHNAVLSEQSTDEILHGPPLLMRKGVSTVKIAINPFPLNGPIHLITNCVKRVIKLK